MVERFLAVVEGYQTALAWNAEVRGGAVRKLSKLENVAPISISVGDVQMFGDIPGLGTDSEGTDDIPATFSRGASWLVERELRAVVVAQASLNTRVEPQTKVNYQ